MGFDLFFIRSRSRDEMVEKTNPFTREVMSVRLLEPLTDSELQAVREVLRGAGGPELDQTGYSLIQFGDGGAAEVHTSGLEEGCAVTLRESLSPDCLRFLLDLLRAAEWVMLPAMDVAPPSIFWGKEEVAIDAFHHAVYALSTGLAYRLLTSPSGG